MSISSPPSLSKRNKQLKITDIKQKIIAEEITIIFFEKFNKIPARECLKQGWKHRTKKHILAPNILEYIETHNRLTKWIQSSILSAINLKLRGKTIKRWIKVEMELYTLRNWQALVAVWSALQSNAIYKLKAAWSLVPNKYIEQHKVIKMVLKYTGNWKNLRRLQLETNPPMIPYFGMFAQDLIVIEETINNRKNDGQINWDSLWRVSTAISKHLIYQNSPYNNLSSDETIRKWMLKELDLSAKLDDDWLFDVSKNVVSKDKKK